MFPQPIISEDVPVSWVTIGRRCPTIEEISFASLAGKICKAEIVLSFQRDGKLRASSWFDRGYVVRIKDYFASHVGKLRTIHEAVKIGERSDSPAWVPEQSKHLPEFDLKTPGEQFSRLINFIASERVGLRARNGALEVFRRSPEADTLFAYFADDLAIVSAAFVRDDV